MDKMDAKEYIRSKTHCPAFFELLAEEASELSHAASKSARILRGEVPTPKRFGDSMRDVTEEFTDVELVMDMLNLKSDPDTKAFKLMRWVERLKQKEVEGENREQTCC